MIRAQWDSLTREQKQEQEEARTMAHDAFIASVDIVARTKGAAGAAWREQLSGDRRRIRDFACYFALFKGIQAR